MKALIKENPEEGYELKDNVPIPDIEPDEVLFKVAKVALNLKNYTK